MTRLRCMRGDITTVAMDAIVNAANSSLMGGGGVDGAIHAAGGPEILTECRQIVARHGPCSPGDAVATGGGALPARWVIHAVGPIWTAADVAAHDVTLARAYERSLAVGVDLGARTMAFPNISTGVYGFPKDRAADVAISAVRRTLTVSDHVDNDLAEVVFVCHDPENVALYEARLSDS